MGCLRLLLAVSACLLGAAHGEWTPRSLAAYARARAGNGDEPVVWHGRGKLQNTITGRHIADVECLERVTRLPKAEAKKKRMAACFRSERVMVYRDEDGAVIRRFSRSKYQTASEVPPLRYSHDVTMEMQPNGQLLLRAAAPPKSANRTTGRQVASGYVQGDGPERTGFRTAYGLFIRPIKAEKPGKGKKGKKAPSPPKPGGAVHPDTPRAAEQETGATRENYRLQATRTGRGETLRYTRVGRCPTWYGMGLCTLEVCSCPEPGKRSWQHAWRRLSGRASPPGFEQRADELCGDESEWKIKRTVLRTVCKLFGL